MRPDRSLKSPSGSQKIVVTMPAFTGMRCGTKEIVTPLPAAKESSCSISLR